VKGVRKVRTKGRMQGKGERRSPYRMIEKKEQETYRLAHRDSLKNKKYEDEKYPGGERRGWDHAGEKR